MKGRFITEKIIVEFKEHLILEEKSEITVEKYIRVKFAAGEKQFIFPDAFVGGFLSVK